MAKAFLIDMDGVLVRGATLIPGAEAFLARLNAEDHPYVIFTNNSRYTQAMLSERLIKIGLAVSPAHIFSSAIATAVFLDHQQPGGSVYAVGGPGLQAALEDVGYRFDEDAPDFVVLGEPITFDIGAVTRAMQLVHKGARFITTNPDVVDPGETGIEPACGAIAAMISAATGVKPYAIGKPNPLMMRCALNHLGVRATEAIIVGDRMDTDIVAGMESGLETVLVLSGVTRREDIDRFSYRPDHVRASVKALVDEEGFWE
ncbi:MAG TPA: HAD-IIA family hydrolase [Kiloniellaceae bacterium]|nr:HAD-IIA family hydrolase [Kiloniellaceae bacterium]